MFTDSQVISALIQRLGGGPITLTLAELGAFGTKYPTKVTFNESSYEVVLETKPEEFATNRRPYREHW